MSIFGAAPGDVLVTLGAQALTSIQHIQGGIIEASLAPNQWQLDVSHWWTTWLASLQAAYVAAATGINDPKLLPYRLAPADEAQWNLCNSQVILREILPGVLESPLLMTLTNGFRSRSSRVHSIPPSAFSGSFLS